MAHSVDSRKRHAGGASDMQEESQVESFVSLTENFVPVPPGEPEQRSHSMVSLNRMKLACRDQSQLVSFATSACGVQLSAASDRMMPRSGVLTNR